jgi:hypothetical protein
VFDHGHKETVMARFSTLPGRLLAFAMLGAVTAGYASAAEPARHDGGIVLVADSAGSDYDKGYRDGFHDKSYRDKNRDNRAYADGYRAGEARRKAGSEGGDGSDYDRGYRDGLNNRDMRDNERRNRAYVDGYRAGESSRRSGAAVGGNADYERGYRDGNEGKKYRDKDRDKRTYAEGYRAGVADRRGGSSSTRPSLSTVRSADELVGRSATRLDSDMKALGYKNWSNSKVGSEAISTWRGRTPSDCKRIVTRSGTVRQVTDAAETDCN